MQVIPVLDLLAGQVVRGVGGRRDAYKPIVSRLTDSSDPIAVAQAFVDQFGLVDMYLADLDAIAGAPPAWSIYESLLGRGFRLWVDAGVRELSEVVRLAQSGVTRMVLGLETIRGPELLEEAHQQFPGRCVFSLDLKAGQPLGRLNGWPESDPLGIARRVAEMGIGHMIVLDLARVGESGGTGTLELCRNIRESCPQVEVIAGGGVRCLDDLHELASVGVQSALIASALHDGKIGAEDLASLLE